MRLRSFFRALILAIVALTFAAYPLFAFERKAEILGSRVAIHEVPNADTKAIAHVNRGVIVDVVGREDAPTRVVKVMEYWYKISYRGKTGWVFGQFLNLDSNKRGLTRVFTLKELIEYCEIETANLKRTREAGAHEALIEFSRAFLKDLNDISTDPILSPHYGELDGYRVLDAYYLALGYLGAGDKKAAAELTEKITKVFPNITLPDGRRTGDLIFELKSLIDEGKGGNGGAD
ncbi:MAG: SH3 domain-containing protein [Deltaproteobacteria bacterium]|uniref:SH3 domain-containing protein n=1 Tax=Candidatus Zymogenus saltonus TaxID=2844893 RepID=A0A9D8KEW4_9DELT|nr:SH3 domain-containing protein [Candidatus Zymogenus saltonus]